MYYVLQIHGSEPIPLYLSTLYQSTGVVSLTGDLQCAELFTVVEIARLLATERFQHRTITLRPVKSVRIFSGMDCGYVFIKEILLEQPTPGGATFTWTDDPTDALLVTAARIDTVLALLNDDNAVMQVVELLEVSCTSEVRGT